jgi:hypothetical protein
MSVLETGFLAVGLAAAAALAAMPLVVWLWHGRDPHFTDDDSVLMPAPPPDFTPALASVVMVGSASRRTVVAGLMHLVSRGLISFRAQPVPVGHRASVVLTSHQPRHLNLPAPEAALYLSIRHLLEESATSDELDLGYLSVPFAGFTKALDLVAVQRGWVRVRPGDLIHRWRILAGAESLTGLCMIWVSRMPPGNDGGPVSVAIVGLGLMLAGLVSFLVSGAMPARTKAGAMLAAMLNGYRRTLRAAIAQSQSLEHVVVMSPLPWVGTPSEEIAWAVAFGLERQIDSLLSTSLEVSEATGWPTGIRDWFSII